jgi:hypothetical protein
LESRNPKTEQLRIKAHGWRMLNYNPVKIMSRAQFGTGLGIAKWNGVIKGGGISSHEWTQRITKRQERRMG